MIITNDFEVGAPLDRAWPVLLDIPRVARCLPGAQLESSDGAVHRGRMSAKIGPISATYAGTATVLEIDDDAHVVVMGLEAREARGQGNANAVLTMRLAGGDDSTRISVETDLKMTGAHAQFGRGILQSVAGAMITTFAANLEAEISGAGRDAAPAEDAPAAQAAPAPAAGGAPLDVASLLPALPIPALGRTAVVAVAGLAVGLLLGRRKRSGVTVHLHFHPTSVTKP